MYSNAIMNEFYNPKNFGVIRGANGVGKVVCDIGNEIIKIFITVEGDKITAAEFQTFGGV
ncbi:MAG: iron-sulfur cluster assembly scaffold protein, partial [Clostridiales bacterium]|nr:iron-sulfur cluster assembly scaffold protein [Clostridiales bacterium]